MTAKPTYQELEQKIKRLEKKLKQTESKIECTKKSLKTSDTRFKKLFDKALFGIIICRLIKDEKGRAIDFEHLQVNAATKQHTGLGPEMISGKRALEIATPKDISNIIEIYGQVVSTGRPYKYDQYFAVYGRHLQVGAFPLDKDLFALTFIDNTEQKKAEARLKKQNYYLEKAQELGQIGTWELDLIKNKLVWTDENCRIFKVPEKSIVDYETFLSKVHPEDRKYVDSEWQAGTRGKPYDIEHRLLLEDEIKWVREKADLAFDAAGKAVRAIGFTQDITARKKLEEQLLQAQKLESIGNLAGGIAHEFNNILSIIIGNNELIMEDLPEQSLSRESSEEIRLAGLRARDIVKHLLTFSRQDNSIKKPIEINSVVTESLKLIRSTTPANIEIREKIAPEPLSILGDSTQINQILINLCSNAVDALPISGGRIDIELCPYHIDRNNQNAPSQTVPPGKYVKLVVRDNGSGMNENICKKIFEPYFTTKEIGKGSGIGLSVVHGIVENHGGSIVCESTKDQGAIFAILIPAHENPVEKKSWKKGVVTGNGERILYVDDEPSIAMLGRRHLESLGYDTCSTTDPKQALEMIRAEPDRFNLVVSDMAMPNIPGDQLIAQIQSINPDIFTMICSGYSSRMSEEKASQMGIKAFLMKPLNKAELAKKVRDVLDAGDPTRRRL